MNEISRANQVVTVRTACIFCSTLVENHHHISMKELVQLFWSVSEIDDVPPLAILAIEDCDDAVVPACTTCRDQYLKMWLAWNHSVVANLNAAVARQVVWNELSKLAQSMKATLEAQKSGAAPFHGDALCILHVVQPTAESGLRKLEEYIHVPPMNGNENAGTAAGPPVVPAERGGQALRCSTRKRVLPARFRDN